MFCQAKKQWLKIAENRHCSEEAQSSEFKAQKKSQAPMSKLQHSLRAPLESELGRWNSS
jgi:hypothetical protein